MRGMLSIILIKELFDSVIIYPSSSVMIMVQYLSDRGLKDSGNLLVEFIIFGK